MDFNNNEKQRSTRHNSNYQNGVHPFQIAIFVSKSLPCQTPKRFSWKYFDSKLKNISVNENAEVDE